MVGIGFHPPQDVPDSDYKFPSSDAEKDCLKIYSDAGITFPSREAARVALPYCDATRLLKLGADNMAADGTFNAAGWAEAVDAHGTEFQTASGFGNTLGNGGRAAPGAYACSSSTRTGHFVYVGPEVPLDDQ